MRLLCLLAFSVAALLHCVSSVKREKTCPQNCVAISKANGLPPITCPDNFQYLTEGDEFVGKVTLYDLPENETITVDLHLSQYEFTKNNNIGNFSLWNDLATSYHNIQNDEPVEYRVIFATQKELPKVTRIAVNEKVICSASAYPNPSESITLQHWFTPFNAKNHKVVPPVGKNVWHWSNQENQEY